VIYGGSRWWGHDWSRINKWVETGREEEGDEETN